MDALGRAVDLAPLAGLAMALANYAGVTLILWPVRWSLERAHRPR